MTALTTIVSDIEARLEADGRLQIVEGLEQPAGGGDGRPLAQLYPEPGTAVRQRMTGGAQSIAWNERIVVSGPTTTAVLAGVMIIRGLLTDWRPDPNPASSPLNEVDNGGQLLTDASEDVANPSYSITIQFRMYLSRSTQA